MHTFLAQPDRYGRFGHQFTSILASYFLASVTGGSFLPVRFAYFAEQWNQVIQFDKSQLSWTNGCEPITSYCSPATPVQSDSINTKVDFKSPSDIAAFLRLVQYSPNAFHSGNTLVHLPFDQKPGFLFRLFPNMKYDLQNIVSYPYLLRLLDCAQPLCPGKYNAIHIRRGDITGSTHPTWYVHSSKILHYFQTHQRTPLSVPNVIVTDARGDELLELRQTFSSIQNTFFSLDFNLDRTLPREHLDWSLLLHAGSVLATMSSFSQLSYILSPYCSQYTMLSPSSQNLLILSDRINSVVV